MQRYQMHQAITMASESKPIVVTQFLKGVSLRTESVFLPETFSMKKVEPFWSRVAAF